MFPNWAQSLVICVSVCLDLKPPPRISRPRHVTGWESEDAVETARDQIAALIGASSKEIVFTSGATESNNIAIKGAASSRGVRLNAPVTKRTLLSRSREPPPSIASVYQSRERASRRSCEGRISQAKFHGKSGKKRHIITTQTEHKCVLDSCRVLETEGYDVTYLPVAISTGLARIAARPSLFRWVLGSGIKTLVRFRHHGWLERTQVRSVGFQNALDGPNRTGSDRDRRLEGVSCCRERD